jgi:hypothetical protein
MRAGRWMVAGAALIAAAALAVPAVRSAAAPAAGLGAAPDTANCDVALLRPECAGFPQYEYANVDGHRIPVVRPRMIVDVRRGPDGAWGTERLAIPGPCAYYRVWTGKWMYDWPAPQRIRDRFPDAHDTFIDYRARTIGRIVLPNGIGSIEPDTDQSNQDRFGHIGSNLNITFDEVERHRGDDTGYWWQYECSVERFAGLKAFPPERIRQKFLEWHAQAPAWRFWEPGQEAPPDIPADPDIAREILAGVINPLQVDYAPVPADSMVNLLTWTWVDGAARGPVDIRITAGGRTVTGRASAGPLRLAGADQGALAPGARTVVDTSGLVCASGGAPYTAHAPDTATDCGVRFGAPTPRAAAGPVLRFTQRWRLSLDGVPVPGTAGTVDRDSPAYTFTVREAQTAN